MTISSHRCWAEIDQDALRHNASVVRGRIGAAELLAVVKANAYGHGAAGVAQALTNDAQLFGVANLGEAIELRNSGIEKPIMILGPALPEERSAIVAGGFIASVSSAQEAAAFGTEQRAVVNFVVDTGMGRMGTREDQAVAELAALTSLRNVTVHSVSTHLPVADQDEAFTAAELSRFEELVRQMRARVPGNYRVHALLSAGILAFQGQPFDLVRAGLMLYGISPLEEFQNVLRPVMSWKTRVALLRHLPAGSSISYGRTFITPRDMRVATLAAGYADGYPRHLSNRDTAVLVRGQRCALLGRITMDLMMIDVSHLQEVQLGDEVVLMGRQGDEEISATELAERASTITWEITTRIGSRVARVYQGGATS